MPPTVQAVPTAQSGSIYADLIAVDRFGGHDRLANEPLHRERHPQTRMGDAEDPRFCDLAFAVRHHRAQARARHDLRTVEATVRRSGQGAWTLILHSNRPFHPERFSARMENLGTGRVRTWGHFWLPTRPAQLASWDGAGGQVSVGVTGPWHQLPDTHLVVVGTGMSRYASARPSANRC